MSSSLASENHLAKGLAAVFQQVKGVEALAILSAVEESQLPCDEAAIRDIWIPALVAAACREKDAISETVWMRAKRLGVLDQAWVLDRRPSMLTEMVVQGPDRVLAPDQSFWGECIQDGLYHPLPTDFDRRRRTSCCAQLLCYGLPHIADEMVKLGLIDPAQAEDGFAHAYPEDQAFAWLSRHIDPLSRDDRGLPIWARLALAPSHSSCQGSMWARDWGKQHDPEGFANLERFEYFEKLARLNNPDEQLAHLISRPDWKDLSDHHGRPALWVATTANAEILRRLVDEKDTPWDVRTSDGKDLWFALIQAKFVPQEAWRALAQHLAPSLDHSGAGWLASVDHSTTGWSHLGKDLPPLLSIEQFNNQVVARWPSVCWSGSPEDQHALAQRLFNMQWSASPKTSENMLMRATVDAWMDQPPPPMHEDLATFVAIWTASDAAPSSNPVETLRHLFPVPFPIPIPELSEPRSNPGLWCANHPCIETASSRLRAWRTLNGPETTPPSGRRIRPRA